MKHIVLTLLLSAAPTLAIACPAQDLAPQKDPLFDLLRVSATEVEGTSLATEIWALFSTAPDAKAQDLLDRGTRYIERGQIQSARTLLDELVAYCPDYAEGWNQRAFARFLDGDYDGALEDIEHTLRLEPRHFGALAGRGLTLMRQGRQILAQKAIRDGLKVHPWLSERRLLPPEQKI